MAASTRTTDEIDKILRDAKLDKSDLEPVTQVLSFGTQMDSDIKLMEIDNSLLNALRIGDRFVIRGESSDHAVLCTKDKTFEMKEADTSNSLLVSADLLLPCHLTQHAEDIIPVEVSSLHHAYFELRPCKPRFQKIKLLLEQNQFQGKELEDENHERKYTTQDLLDVVQASEEELKLGLLQIQAYSIDGYWRVLEFDYKYRVVTHILNFIEENSWTLSKVHIGPLLNTLSELEPREVLEQCCGHLAKGGFEPRDATFAIDEDEICRIFAEVVLRHAGKFHLHEFLEVWRLSVPEGVTANLSQLKGLALVDRQSFPESISYFPSSNLPEDINDRFNSLFKTREKWTLDDIEPYIRDIATKELDVNGLLTKFARTSTIGGIKYYNSKRPARY